MGSRGDLLPGPAREIKKKAKLFKIITDSYRWNPKWRFAEEKFRATIFAQKLRQQQANFRSTKRAIKSQREAADMQWESMRKHSKAQDRMSEQYVRSLRSVDVYADPVDDSKVELPSGYENTWTDGA